MLPLVYKYSDSWSNPKFMDDPEHKDLINCSRRVADAMNLHAVAKSAGWAAFKLSDGTSDNVPYARRVDAVRAMKWDRDNYAYLEIAPDGMTDKEAYHVFKYARFLYLKGWRLPDPDFDFDPTMPAFAWDQRSSARNLISGGKIK